MAGLLLFSSGLAAAQGSTGWTLFAGAVTQPSSGFAAGGGVFLKVAPKVYFEPTFSLGQVGHDGLFTLDGSFRYMFHLQGSQIKPYVLGGVGLSEFDGSTHGSPIVGVGARFPTSGGWAIEPEFRIAGDGLGRFTIGLVKTF